MGESNRQTAASSGLFRAFLFAGAIVGGLTLFFALIGGIFVLRVKLENRETSRTVSAMPSATPTSRTADPMAILPPAAVEPPKRAIQAIKREPQRIALWAMSATVQGKGIKLGGKRDKVIGEWSNPDATVSWSIDPAEAEYFIDLVYGTRGDDGGNFSLKVGGKEFPGTINSRSRQRGSEYRTLRLGKVTLPSKIDTLTIRAAEAPRRSLMSLLRVDLIPLKEDGSPTTIAQGLPELVRPPEPVSGLVLIDTETGRPIQKLSNGATINLASLPRERLSMQAEIRGTVGSVRFSYNEDDDFWTEDNPPYTIRGNERGRTRNLPLRPGEHRLTATPFAGPRATGPAGTSLSLRFKVIDKPDRAPVGGIVTGISIVDTESNEVLWTLSDQGTLDLARFPAGRISLRAEVAGDPGSVRFDLNDSRPKHIENDPPYAIAGDRDGRLLSYSFKPGKYRLRVTPFAEEDGQGKAGRAYDLNFAVIESGKARREERRDDRRDDRREER